jgi:hypothetical protein
VSVCCVVFVVSFSIISSTHHKSSVLGMYDISTST